MIRIQGVDIVSNKEKIKDRWSEYSNELLNEENKKNPVTQAASTEGLVLDLQWKKKEGKLYAET